jgi:hypothetical protein
LQVDLSVIQRADDLDHGHWHFIFFQMKQSLRGGRMKPDKQ